MMLVTKTFKVLLTSAIAVFGGTSMAGAQSLPPVSTAPTAITVDSGALHAGDEASLNDTAVQIVAPGYSPSPDPLLADEAVAGAVEAESQATTPTIAPAVATPTDEARTASRMISRPQVQDIEKTLAAQKKSDPFVIKSILEIDGPIKYGEWFWDDEGVAPGQACVFYSNEDSHDQVLGGGWIRATNVGDLNGEIKITDSGGTVAAKGKESLHP